MHGEIHRLEELPETLDKEMGGAPQVRPDADASAKAGLWGSILAGIAASACCAGPLLLLSLGLGGSWLSTFSKLEPLRPLFIAVALVFLALTYRKLYLLPQRCESGSACALDPGLKVQRRLFWITAVVVLAVITFPWWGVLLLDD